MNKPELRSIYIEKRKQIDQQEYYELSQRLVDSFVFNFYSFLTKPSTLHCYLPLEKSREPNTHLLINTVFKRFKQVRVAVPSCDFDTNILFHTLVDQNTFYDENKYGIPEPVNGNIIDNTAVDLVIVPLLAFDVYGHRVGYGGGYYDRFLAKVQSNCIKVGLSFFEPTPYRIDTEPTDIALDYCVTPTELYNFTQPNGAASSTVAGLQTA